LGGFRSLFYVKRKYMESVNDSFVLNIEPEINSRSFNVFRDMYIRSNSPVLSSHSSSDEERERKPSLARFGGEYKKHTLKDVEASIGHMTVNEHQVVAVYLKAQKDMYIKSGNWISICMYVLTGTAVCLSLTLLVALCASVLVSQVAIVCISGSSTVLFSVAFYMRLDSSSTRAYLLANSIGNFDWGLDIHLIYNEKNKFDVTVPWFVGRMFPFVNGVDFVHLFRLVQSLRMQMLQDLVDTKNEIERIVFRLNDANSLHQWKSGESLSVFLQTKQKEELRLVRVMETKETLKCDIDKYNAIYESVIDLIHVEMQCAEYIQGWGLFSKNPFASIRNDILDKIHPTIRKHIVSISANG